MLDMERNRAIDMKHQAFTDIRAYYHEIIPEDKRELFKRLAKKMPVDIRIELDELKLILSKTDINFQDYCQKINRFKYISKSMIRTVSFAVLLNK